MRNKKGFDRNYFAMTFEGSLFIGSISVMAAGGAMAVFIDTMTGSKTLVGLAITLQSLCLLLGQLIGAPFVRSIKDLPNALFKIMSCQRVIPLIMAVPLFFSAGPYVAVGVFLVLYGAFWSMDGVIATPWSELAARALKPELRGHMMGMQVVIGSGLSLLTGLLLTWLLATPALTDNFRYGYIFILTAVVLLPSLFFIRIVKDPQPIGVPEKVDFKKYYAKIPSLIKESKPLQRALVARIPGYIGFSVVSFMIVFGANTLDISDVQVSWLVYSKIVGGLLGGYVSGEASRLFGNKAVILMCNAGVFVTIMMAIALIIFPVLGYIWLVALCVLASLWANSWLGYLNYLIDISPTEHRPAYQVIGGSIGIPFSFVGYGIGAIIDEWGYTVAFILGAVTAAITIIVSSRLLSRKQIKALKLT